MSLSTKNDYYAVLGVSRKADVETVKAAWKKLARLKHPDKNPGNPHATAEFQKVRLGLPLSQVVRIFPFG